MCGPTVIDPFPQDRAPALPPRPPNAGFVLVPVWGLPGRTPPFPSSVTGGLQPLLFSPEEAVRNAVSAQWHSSLSPQRPTSHKTFTLRHIGPRPSLASYPVAANVSLKSQLFFFLIIARTKWTCHACKS